MDITSFVRGFEKRSEALTGGSGHTGRGKGNLSLGRYDYPSTEGPRGAFEGAEEGSPRNAKAVYDRVGNPRSHSIFDNGITITDDSNPHIRY